MGIKEGKEVRAPGGQGQRAAGSGQRAVGWLQRATLCHILSTCCRQCLLQIASYGTHLLAHPQPLPQLLHGLDALGTQPEGLGILPLLLSLPAQQQGGRAQQVTECKHQSRGGQPADSSPAPAPACNAPQVADRWEGGCQGRLSCWLRFSSRAATKAQQLSAGCCLLPACCQKRSSSGPGAAVRHGGQAVAAAAGTDR